MNPTLRALLLAASLAPAGCAAAPHLTPYQSLLGGKTLPDGVELLTVRVVRKLPHDPTAFTQGLLFHKGRLFESTGLQGQGGIRELSLSRAEPLRQVPNTLDVFPEGLATDGTVLVQLTEEDGFARVWDPDTLKELRRFEYEGPGWGLCFDGTAYLRSDGSTLLHRHARDTFAETGTVRVTLGGRQLRLLNELEWAKGAIFANVWFAPELVRIDPASGKVTAIIDARALVDENPRKDSDDVLNGIAFEPESGHFFLTGKRWRWMYEVELVPRGG